MLLSFDSKTNARKPSSISPIVQLLYATRVTSKERKRKTLGSDALSGRLRIRGKNSYLSIRCELEVERVKFKDGKSMQPLCMAQHYRMLRLYRRPGVNGDEQILLDRAASGDHIIVAHHNQVTIVIVSYP